MNSRRLFKMNSKRSPTLLISGEKLFFKGGKRGLKSFAKKCIRPF